MKISPWAAGAMKVAVFSAAFAIPGTGIAMAAGPVSITSGNGSILGGNQVNLPVSAPVDICGNAVGILGGLAGAGCEGGASVTGGGSGSGGDSGGGGGSGGSGGVERTSGNGSILGGNQVNAPVSVPVDVCGNSVAAAGGAISGCRGGASVGGTTRHSRDSGSSAGGTSSPSYERTSGNGSILGGNQVNAPVSAPINLCGNALALLGESGAACVGGASVTGAGSGGATFERTSGNGSIGGGNQINAPVSAPINACGNAVAILGSAFAGCRGGATVTGTTTSSSERTSGNGSILGGNQVNAPVSAPVNACGNAVALAGTALARCEGGSTAGHAGHAR